MRILVIGGTSFVGRHIAQTALDRGHDVTVFNRGQTNPDALPKAEHLIGDRNADLGALEGRSWDATVDVCGYVPRQVRSLLTSLGEHAGHYTFISTLSVFPDDVSDGYTEDSALCAPAWNDELVMDKYGELKVGCELTARELSGDRLLIVRPGYVVGPHDHTGRFTYWIERVADGRAPMAGPDAAQPFQCIDARDLAAFTVAQVESGTVDAFNVTAPHPAPTFAQVLEAIARGTGTRLPEIRWVGARDELPLTLPPSAWALMTADLTKARSAGLHWRPLEQTVSDTLEWVRAARAEGRYTPRPGVGLSAADEQRMLAGA